MVHRRTNSIFSPVHRRLTQLPAAGRNGCLRATLIGYWNVEANATNGEEQSRHCHVADRVNLSAWPFCHGEVFGNDTPCPHRPSAKILVSRLGNCYRRRLADWLPRLLQFVDHTGPPSQFIRSHADSRRLHRLFLTVVLHFLVDVRLRLFGPEMFF
jgi:hypothetical protein